MQPILRETLNEDVEEEKVGTWNRKEEVACLARCLEVEELVSELGDDGDVMSEAVEDELSVGLGEVRERTGSVQKPQKEVTATRCGGGDGFAIHLLFYFVQV
ncbi:hypothetical protein HS088_TW09G00135 [Tripterygium wilfordii]|uniref:Uncharacterized protein n=1 Tax=Tripterygium wilfordii TaxID=458696 RepID=A0A7J7D706_TRIWF|nr:hypothetical protein HS088_TW09G00135 [Tripterygium wilfordii]